MLLLGMTKAALTTDSFLSAASFQETARVLTEINPESNEWEAIFNGDWVSVRETGILPPVFSRKNLIISIVYLPISVSFTGR